MSFIRGDATYIDYVGPSGRMYPLTGPRRGSMGVQLIGGVEGFLGPTSSIRTVSAARQHGADVSGAVVGSAEYDLEFDVWGKTPHEWSVVNRSWLDDWDMLRTGFMRAYSSDLGWRWCQVRQGRDHSGTYVKDPRRIRVAKYKQMVLATGAYWRSKDYEKTWIDNGAHIIRMKLWNGGDVDAWPQFLLEGQCGFRIRYLDNDFTVPTLEAGETVKISTTQTDQTIRSLTRNLLPALKGRYFQNPIPPGQVTTVIIETIDGAGQVQARVPQQFKRPI